MAARQRRELDSSEEDNFLETVEAFGLLQYQFKPECAGGEPVSTEERSESSDSDTELGEEGEPEVWHVGNHDWCTSELCGPMPTARESHCCQELDVLEDKRSEGVGEGKLSLFSFFYSMACYKRSMHAIVSLRFTV